jgi:hypothetical protein
MRLESIRPSLLNFLSGTTITIALTIALNFRIGVPPETAGSAFWQSSILATPWGISAVFWTLAAANIQDALDAANLKIIKSRITPESDEISALKEREIKKVAFRTRLYITLGAVLVIVGLAIQGLQP